MASQLHFALLTAAVSLLLAGCGVRPRYIKPSVTVPSSYKDSAASLASGDWKPAQPGDVLPRGKWWEAFGDPRLNQLEQQVSISNQNIAAAAASVQSARAMIRESRSQFYPTVAANPSITKNRISTVYGHSVSTSFNSYALPLEASWEPDLWGRVRNNVKASTYGAEASAADLENLRLAAQADLAAAYFQMHAEDALK